MAEAGCVRALHAVEKRRGGQEESEKSQAACFQQASCGPEGVSQTRLQSTFLLTANPQNFLRRLALPKPSSLFCPFCQETPCCPVQSPGHCPGAYKISEYEWFVRRFLSTAAEFGRAEAGFNFIQTATFPNLTAG